jgi:hypothetical protein
MSRFSFSSRATNLPGSRPDSLSEPRDPPFPVVLRIFLSETMLSCSSTSELNFDGLVKSLSVPLRAGLRFTFVVAIPVGRLAAGAVYETIG